MELFPLVDQFYPLKMRIYQAKHLLEDLKECGVRYLPKESDAQRYYAYTELLYDVLDSAISNAEAFQAALEDKHHEGEH